MLTTYAKLCHRQTVKRMFNDFLDKVQHESER